MVTCQCRSTGHDEGCWQRTPARSVIPALAVPVGERCGGCGHHKRHHLDTDTNQGRCAWIACGCPWFVSQDDVILQGGTPA